MKRRAFLTTAGTIGIAGVVSASSIPTSSDFYNEIGEKALSKDFSEKVKQVHDHFISEVTYHVRDLNIPSSYIDSITTPVRILRKDYQNGNQRVLYKNKAGDFVELSIEKGQKVIRIYKKKRELLKKWKEQSRA